MNLLDRDGRWFECTVFSEGICREYEFDPTPHMFESREMPDIDMSNGGDPVGDVSQDPATLMANIARSIVGRLNQEITLLDGTKQKPCEQFLKALSKAVGLQFDLSAFSASAAKYVSYDPGKTGRGTPNGYYDPATGRGYVYSPAFGSRSSGDYVSTAIHEDFHVVSKLTDQNLMKYIGIAIGLPNLSSSGRVVGGPDPYFSRYCGPDPKQFP